MYTLYNTVGKYIAWLLFFIAFFSDRGFVFVNWLVNLKLWSMMDIMIQFGQDVLSYNPFWTLVFVVIGLFFCIPVLALLTWIGYSLSQIAKQLKWSNE